MPEILLYAVCTSAALALGGVLGTVVHVRQTPLGLLLAFSSGALIAALALDLFGASVAQGGPVRATVALMVGAATFVAVDSALDRVLVGRSADQQEIVAAGGQRVGWALLAAVTLDGVPENLALGVSLAGGEGSVALLAAIMASNLPEAMAGAQTMRDGGLHPAAAMGTWGVTALVLGVLVVVGSLGLRSLSPGTLAYLNAFAGGAVLASLADTLMPQAYTHGQPWNALTTSGGFAMSFLLSA